MPRPDEVLTMAEKYKRPSLCNCYCSQQCPIGQRYVPFVTRRELPAIILEMLASLNAMNSKKERLIEIAADGKISNDEIDDFIHIRQELERISLTVETLQLWTERMLANGQIERGDVIKGSWRNNLLSLPQPAKNSPLFFLFLSCFCNNSRAKIVLQVEGTRPA